MDIKSEYVVRCACVPKSVITVRGVSVERSLYIDPSSAEDSNRLRKSIHHVRYESAILLAGAARLGRFSVIGSYVLQCKRSDDLLYSTVP